MLLGTLSVSVSSVKWQKCRHLVSGLGVHSLHLSSEKQGRRFVRNLLQRAGHSCSSSITGLCRKTIFSRGLLCSGRRNRVTRSLTVRVCLKMNMGILCSLGVRWLTVKRKWMQNAYHKPDTSDWLSLTNHTLAYEWCVLIQGSYRSGKTGKGQGIWVVRESQGKSGKMQKWLESQGNFGENFTFFVQLL